MVFAIGVIPDGIRNLQQASQKVRMQSIRGDYVESAEQMDSVVNEFARIPDPQIQFMADSSKTEAHRV